MSKKALVPSNINASKRRVGDPRVGEILSREVGPDTVAALIGFPTDVGVVRNGGRPGAAAGPGAVRTALYKFTPDAEHPRESGEMWRRTADLGDIAVSGDLAADQALLGEVVGDLLIRGIVPIIIGGGHETALGHFLGYVKAQRNVSIINIDAHPDVRELIDSRGHSGSPFREALEHPSKRCVGYSVLGLEPHTCAGSHIEYIEQRGGAAIFRTGTTSREIDRFIGSAKSTTMVTLDLDAVDEVAAPGVSAPCVAGLSIDLWLRAAWCAGANPAITSLDIVECNPTFDIDNRTARLAALTIWHLVKGLHGRPPLTPSQGPPSQGL